jgi:hypothetical protein
MNKLLAGALIAAVVGVAGCSGFGSTTAADKNPAPCPNIVVLLDASRIIEFDGEERLEDIAYTGEITNVEVGCRYVEDKPIDAEISIDLAFGKGPKGQNGDKVFKYFVAVTRKDLEVIAKTEFLAPVKFTDKNTIVVKKEDIDKIFIPRAGEHISGSNFEIIVGFSLSRDQIIFNRSGKSLKFPNLK